jgi:hypothetical protein
VTIRQVGDRRRETGDSGHSSILDQISVSGCQVIPPQVSIEGRTKTTNRDFYFAFQFGGRPDLPNGHRVLCSTKVVYLVGSSELISGEASGGKIGIPHAAAKSSTLARSRSVMTASRHSNEGLRPTPRLWPAYHRHTAILTLRCQSWRLPACLRDALQNPICGIFSIHGRICRKVRPVKRQVLSYLSALSTGKTLNFYRRSKCSDRSHLKGEDLYSPPTPFSLINAQGRCRAGFAPSRQVARPTQFLVNATSRS